MDGRSTLKRAYAAWLSVRQHTNIIGGAWWATLPIYVWVFIMVLRILWRIGFAVLRGAWFVIGSVRNVLPASHRHP